MQFRDLNTQYLLHKEQIDKAIAEVIGSTAFINGSQVRELEKELASYVGAKHCITCGNGTDALLLALMAWGIGEGDAVFVPDFTFFSSAEVVPVTGATPIFVDVKYDTLNISEEDLSTKIEWTLENTRLKPKVVVAVDLFGQPAEYDKIRQVTDKYELLLLEDGAQGFGGRIGSDRACSFGDISTTSFFPAKPLGCYGDGGAVFTDNDEWAELIRSYKVHGKGDDKYDNVRIGMNSRLDTIQAGILLEKFKFFEDEVAKCNEVAHAYDTCLKTVQGIVTPYVKEGYTSSWAQYTILLKDEERRRVVMKGLSESDIPSMIYYKKPMHRQRAFADNICSTLDYPVSDDICGRCLSLPMSAYMDIKDIEEICGHLKQLA